MPQQGRGMGLQEEEELQLEWELEPGDLAGRQLDLSMIELAL